MNEFMRELFDGVLRLDFIPTGEPGTTTNFVIGSIRNLLILVFSGVIILAIIYIVVAGLKYIRSQGETDKIEEAQEAIKSVFIGILAVFIGIIGVVVLSGIFTNPAASEVRRAMCSFIEPTEVEKCVKNVDTPGDQDDVSDNDKDSNSEKSDSK